jgi:hypothetical protein
MGQRAALLISTTASSSAALAELALLLKAPDIGVFDAVEMLEAPDAATLQEAIAAFFRLRKPADLLFLFFHGAAVATPDGDLQLVTGDATNVPLADLTSAMNRSFSRRQIVIIDARADATRMVDALEGDGKWRQVLCRGTADPLLPRLAAGLADGSADVDRDGWIDLREVHEYLCAAPGAGGAPVLARYGSRERFFFAGNGRQAAAQDPIKWDILTGMVLTPLIIAGIGGLADGQIATVFALFFLLLYGMLYRLAD